MDGHWPITLQINVSWIDGQFKLSSNIECCLYKIKSYLLASRIKTKSYFKNFCSEGKSYPNAAHAALQTKKRTFADTRLIAASVTILRNFKWRQEIPSSKIRRTAPTSIDQIADVLLWNDCIADTGNVSDRCPLQLVSYEESSSRIVPSANPDTIDVECPCHSSISTMRASGGISSPYASLRLHETVGIKKC